MRIVKSIGDVQIVLRQLLNWQSNETAVSNRNQRGYQIKNAGAATDPTDLVTLAQVQDLVSESQSKVVAAAATSAAAASQKVTAGAKAATRSVFVNPMVSAGDMIAGGAGGQPARVPAAVFPFSGSFYYLATDGSGGCAFKPIGTTDLPVTNSAYLQETQLRNALGPTRIAPTAALFFPSGLYSLSLYLVGNIIGAGANLSVNVAVNWTDSSNFTFSTGASIVTTSANFAAVSLPIQLLGGQALNNPIVSSTFSGSGVYSFYLSLVALH